MWSLFCIFSSGLSWIVPQWLRLVAVTVRTECPACPSSVNDLAICGVCCFWRARQFAGCNDCCVPALQSQNNDQLRLVLHRVHRTHVLLHLLIAVPVIHLVAACAISSIITPLCDTLIYGFFSGGQLSAWLRIRYPDVIAGAISSSPTFFGAPGLGLVNVHHTRCASQMVLLHCGWNMHLLMAVA